MDDSDEERFAEHLWSARDQVVALALENTHLMREGHVMTPEAAVRFARIGVPVHLDGARLMNAAAALEVPPADLAACATTVTLTLSKGLGAPIGSVLAGPEEVMNRARQSRLAMGGSLAQAGVVAAAGLVALRRPRRSSAPTIAGPRASGPRPKSAGRVVRARARRRARTS
ncbi:beta-eliminating lyase-related protein [Actinomadura madurae]|uniref:beta-eliminating lyase-related protein n=1 Tax=Actinomadura madurae TaxID=1993 RepID=UPI0020D25BC2|nr:beta-eliminating lyase-related protein [Actinomadura madurae]